MKLIFRIDNGSSGMLQHSFSSVPSINRTLYKIELTSGSEGFYGSCSLCLDISELKEMPWFMIPGFFYGQGRTDSKLRYPSLGRSNDEWTYPSWDFALDRAAVPLVLAFQKDRWLGLDADPHYIVKGASSDPSVWGESEPQIGLGLQWENENGELRINIPANERPRRHARNPRNGETAKKLHLAPGESIELCVGIWDFAADEHGYQLPVATLYSELKKEHQRAELLPHADLAECAAHGLRAWHWTPPQGDLPGYMVYTTPLDRSVEFNSNVNRQTSLGWHFEALGFVGGFPVAFGLLWQGLRYGNSTSVAIARQLADRFCREALSPSGLFRTSYHPGNARTRNGTFANGPESPFYGSCWQGIPDVAHARTTADASYYLGRMCSLVGPSDPSYKEWKSALRMSLAAALSLQREDGRHGQIYDVVNSNVRQWEGCGGMLWIAAMDAGHDLFDDDSDFQLKLRQSMKAAGEAYANDVRKEYIFGAPEDVSLAPTSEDGYNAIMCYGRLHRRFGDEENLRLLQQSADWTLTWRKSYNVMFDKRNILGAGQFRTVGGDFASSNNNHLHVYGLNCLSELYRLSEVTGDIYYADRATDNFAFASQQLCFVDGQWNGQRGMLTEQFYTNDWSIWDSWDPGPDHVQKGTVMGFSHVWCINIILLGLEELERAGRLEKIR